MNTYPIMLPHSIAPYYHHITIHAYNFLTCIVTCDGTAPYSQAVALLSNMVLSLSINPLNNYYDIVSTNENNKYKTNQVYSDELMDFF